MRSTLRKWCVACALSCLILSACAPPIETYATPQTELPAGKHESEDWSKWWECFKDPALTALVEEALKNNPDILLAAAKLEQSRGSLRLAQSNLFPSIFANAGGNRHQISVDGNIPPAPGQQRLSTVYTANLSASYEVDFWGKLAAQRKGAQESLKASLYAQEMTRTVVAAQVARSYFTLRALDRDLDVLEKTLATRDKAVGLQKKRLDAGLIGAYEYALAEAERNAAAAILPGVRTAVEQAEISLSVILGRSPRALVEEKVARGAGADVLSKIPPVPGGLTSDLLMRRPDVIAAEHMLHAVHASVNEARAKWFPSIILSGVLGGESVSLHNLLTGPASTWTLASALAQPISGLWTVNAQIKYAKAVRGESEVIYQQVVRRAYADVLTALSVHKGSAQTLIKSEKLFENQDKVKSLAQRQFEVGKISRIALLDAERERFAAERALVAAQRDRALALVSVYQALGGGWDVGEKTP
ncbi:MAG: efflux transporter outer membrane subunit [Alphaproteobacteria bacterium]|nr:efflux transporter outer membrane subunit [Alphaproteobacteria bacterium]